MKNLTLFAAALAILAGCGSSHVRTKAADSASDGASVVYFTREITPESLVKIYEALGRETTGRVTVKISTGNLADTTTSSPN